MWPSDDDIKLLEKHGWIVECQSPFEIRNEDGSFAAGEAAQAVIDCLTHLWEDDEKPKNKQWFMSYYKQSGNAAIASILSRGTEALTTMVCSCTTSKHPVKLINEWNKQQGYKYVLISFMDISDQEKLEMDVGFPI